MRTTKGDVRLPENPIAWVGPDRILLNDITSLGLRRKVIARKDDIPNQVLWLQMAFEEAKERESTRGWCKSASSHICG